MEHPINGLIEEALSGIKGMVDVNTIIGNPVETPDGTIIIPVSKVGFGFAAGGSDFEKREKDAENNAMFGGGSGAGVSIKPVAFLVVGQGQIKLLPLTPQGDNATSAVDKLFQYVPQIFEKVNDLLDDRKAKKAAEKEVKEEDVATEQA